MSIHYEELLDKMTQITSVILDLEGGRWLLSVIYELLQILLATGDYKGCRFTIQLLNEAAIGNRMRDITDSEVYFIIKETFPDIVETQF